MVEAKEQPRRQGPRETGAGAQAESSLQGENTARRRRRKERGRFLLPTARQTASTSRNESAARQRRRRKERRRHARKPSQNRPRARRSMDEPLHGTCWPTYGPSRLDLPTFKKRRKLTGEQ